MNHSFLIIACVMLMSSCSFISKTNSTKNETSKKLAQSPPMGWNSFISYGAYLHEEVAMDNLEAFAEKLQPFRR